MLNRLISNIVLGFFVVVLITVYGVAKQAPSYSLQSNNQKLSADMSGQGEPKSDDVKEAGDLSGTSAVVLPSGKTITARVADTEEKREQGLSGTDSLKDGEGML